MLTTREAAARLGLTPQSIARLCKQKRIVAIKHGRDYLISEDELARFAALSRPAHRPRRMIMDPLKQYRQTVGANYSSRPKIADVLSELHGDSDWQETYAGHGHGEYIGNVCTLVAALRPLPRDIDLDRLIADLSPLDR